MIRSRKLKCRNVIEALPSDCNDIFCPTIIDTYYPNRPQNLDNVNLYDYVRWYDVSKHPLGCNTEYHEIFGIYMRKRTFPYFISDIKYHC